MSDHNISLREVTRETLKSVLELDVNEKQRKFVASNAKSIAEAHFSKDAWFRAIYLDDTPIGFAMLSDIPEKAEYFLWRFMIDAQHQGKGFGKSALKLLVEHVRQRPNAEAFYTSYIKGDHGPEEFYLNFGFSPTGEVDDDGEHLLKIDL